MNIEEIINLIDISAISKDYLRRYFGLWVDCDEERMMEITIEEVEN